MQSPLVENEIYSQAPGGTRAPFTVTIWPPAPHPDGDFVCRLALTHKPRTIEVGGVDALQALALTMRFLQIEFQVLQRAGWLFYFDEAEDEPFDPGSTYSPVLPPEAAA